MTPASGVTPERSALDALKTADLLVRRTAAGHRAEKADISADALEEAAALLRSLREALQHFAVKGAVACMVEDDDDGFPAEAPVVGCECVTCRLAALLSGAKEGKRIDC